MGWKRWKSLATALATIAWLCTGIPVAVAQSEETTETSGHSTITGNAENNANAPLVGATVLAYHLSTEKVYRSEPTNGKGNFRIPDLPMGYYDLAIETSEGLFVGNQVVNLPPTGKAVVNFRIAPFDSTTGNAERNFPGSTTTSEGVAAVREKQTGRDFWRSAKGVAILAGTGGAILLAIAADDGDTVPSQTTPIP